MDKLPTAAAVSFTVLSLAALLLLFLAYPDKLPIHPSLISDSAAPPELLFGYSDKLLLRDRLSGSSSSPADVRILLGVFTEASFYERRNLLRLTYALQQPVNRAAVDVRFVVCDGKIGEADAVLVAMEMAAYGDIVVLNCSGNGDGSAHEFFVSLPELPQRPCPGSVDCRDSSERKPYHYIGKVNDATHFRLDALAAALEGKARTDAYVGFVTPCSDGSGADNGSEWMTGMGFIVSSDVADWIAAAGAAPAEDAAVRDFLLREGKASNVYRMAPLRYGDWNGGEKEGDSEDQNCRRRDDDEVVAGVVAVHELGDRHKWARALAYMNITGGVRPEPPVLLHLR